MSPRRRALLASASMSLLGIRASPVAPAHGPEALRLAGILLPGDVVFRSGLSVESSAVLAARPHSRFSHVGIIADTSAGRRVVHALPPERGFAGGVVSSTWAEFAVAPDVRAAGVFRVSGASAGERARIAAQALRLLGAPFNSGLDLGLEHGVYCTQLALAALVKVDAEVATFVHATPITFLAQPVYLPDALLDWPRLVEIAR